MASITTDASKGVRPFISTDTRRTLEARRDLLSLTLKLYREQWSLEGTEASKQAMIRTSREIDAISEIIIRSKWQQFGLRGDLAKRARAIT
jgi:hypothetical protein